MAKTATASTRPPWLFSSGREIIEEDAQEAVENLNYAAAENPITHISLVCGGQHWGDSGNEIVAHGIRFPSSGTSFVERYEFDIFVDVDTPSVRFAAECFFNASNTGEVRVTIGGQQATLAFANSDNGNEKEITAINRSAMTLSSGWAYCTVEIRRVTGAATDNELLNWRVEDSRITSLPDPVDE